MPSDLVLKTMNGLHRALLTVSGGRLGWEFSNMPVLELTTTGRKSGQRRAVMLTSPIQEDSTLVVVASRGGDPTHPAWFLNLRDNADVEVAYKGGDAKPMTATVADAETRDRLWPEITSRYPTYGGYQKKTTREIPLVLLTPR